MGVNFPAGTWVLWVPRGAPSALGLQGMTQCGMCGAVSPGLSTSPGQRPLLIWVPEQAVPTEQAQSCLLPLWLGSSRAACSELCQAPFGGILVSDRGAIWHSAETQHGVHSGGAHRDGKAVAHLPLPCGLGVGAGALLGTPAELCVPHWREWTLSDPALLGTDWAAARKMRDFQGQLCFTNPVIMPLKILIVLAIVNCGTGGLKGEHEGRRPREGGLAGCHAGDSVSVGAELQGRGVVTCGVEHVLLMMLRAWELEHKDGESQVLSLRVVSVWHFPPPEINATKEMHPKPPERALTQTIHPLPILFYPSFSKLTAGLWSSTASFSELYSCSHISDQTMMK